MKTLKNSINGWLMALMCCLSIVPVMAEENSLVSTLGSNASKPHVKMDSAGNGVISWIECEGNVSHLKVVKFTKDGKQSEAQTVRSFPGECGDHGAKLVVDAAGDTSVVWQEPKEDGVSVIKTSSLESADFESNTFNWRESQNVVDLMPQALRETMISNEVDAAGNVLASLVDTDGNKQVAFFIHGHWKPALDVDNIANAKLAVDSTGNVLALWEETVNNQIGIQGARLPFETNKWTSLSSIPNAHSLQFAINPLNNDAVATWVGKNEVIKTAELKSNANAWSKASDLSGRSVKASQPQIAIDNKGNPTIVWTAKTSKDSVIQSVTESAYKNWAGNDKRQWSSVLTASAAGGNASDPQLTVDGEGNIMATWGKTISADNIIVQSAKLPKGAEKWTPPSDLSSKDEKAGAPQLVMGESGKNMVVWPNAAGNIQVFSNTFAACCTDSSCPCNPEPNCPCITQIFPDCGKIVGGTMFSIQGSGFMTGSTTVSEVTFGTTAATSFQVQSNTLITGVAPAGTGTVTVTVTSPPPGGTSNGVSFAFQNSPTITSITPNSGSANGNNTVTIAGMNFITVNAVLFNGIPGTIVTPYSPMSIDVIVPPAVSCTNPVNVTVCNCTGCSNAVAYTYIFPVPTITGLSPTSGPSTGATVVMITGTNFNSGSTVTFGGVAGTVTNVSSDGTTITVTTPPTTSTACTNPVNVVVNSCGQTVTAPQQFTYDLGAPTILANGLSPTSGSSAGATVVMITGRNFNSGSTVTFGGVAGTVTNVAANGTTITVTTPANSSTACTTPVNVVVTSCSQTVTAPQQFTYDLAVPTATNINPSSGSMGGGTSVTITGTNFNSGSTVTFGGVAGTVTNVAANGTTITVTTPAHNSTACSVLEKVIVTSCGKSVGLNQQFDYILPAPTILANGLSPTSGPSTGGTIVTIMGMNFNSDSTVAFGGVAGTDVNVSSDGTTITVTTPANSSTACTTPVNVVVTSCSQTVTAPQQFTYDLAVPTATNINPSSGSMGGGTSVTITGTNFNSGSTVTFGGVAGTVTNVATNGTTITVTTPASTSTACTTAVNVVVTSCSQTVTAPQQFTYDFPAPTVLSMSPISGPSTGGTIVTIMGMNFNSDSTVAFGGVAGTDVNVSSDGTTITVTTPANSSTACTTPVNVVVTSCSQTVTAPQQFTYDLAVPTATNINPSSGSMGGGTSVTITGTNFNSGSTVTFGGVAGTVTNVATNGTTITVTTPASTSTACTTAVNVVVTSCSQTVTAPQQFTYDFPAPTVLSMSPISGPSTGGTIVTIMGMNFNSDSTVAFGGVAGTDVNVSSDGTTITVTTPATTSTDCTISVIVAVTSCGQTVDAPSFTYIFPAPSVSGMNPTSGDSIGGTTVMISGTGFNVDSSVTFGGIAGTVTSVSPDGMTITVNTPAAAANSLCTVPVVVTSCNQSVDAPSFTYDFPAPVLGSLSPDSGPVDQSVTIMGSNFHAPSTVDFGGVLGTDVVVVSSTEITVTAPLPLNCNVDVTVGSCGQDSSNSLPYTYTGLPAPTITSLVNPYGPSGGGNTITINGMNFIGITLGANSPSVTFGGQNADVIGYTNTTITVTVPAATGTPPPCFVDVVVTGCAGTVTLPDGYGYQYGMMSGTQNPAAAPTIESITPNPGPIAGSPPNPEAQIAGTGFVDVNFVSFGGVDVPFDEISPTAISSNVPPANGSGPCEVPVLVDSCMGGTSAPFPYNYDFPTPTITGISPNTGDYLGADTVTISGTSFASITSVTFGGVEGTNILVNSAGTEITVTTPAAVLSDTNCVVDVAVSGCSGNVTLGNGYTYEFPSPTITSVNPPSGPVAGGTEVTITGTYFYCVQTVDFGGVSVPFTVVSPTEIIVTSPAASLLASMKAAQGGNCTTVDITVTTDSGTSNAGQFTYLTFPSVTGISPTSGPAAGGNTVTITGTGFLSVTGVQFGTVAATNVTVDPSGTSITATVPAGTNCSTVDITVTNCAGTSPTGSGDQYTYTSAPTVTSVSPNSGPAYGGTEVTITGTNFNNVTAVLFGGVNATSFKLVSPTTITAVAPAGFVGIVDITVLACGGTSVINGGDQFTYLNTIPVAPSRFIGCIKKNVYLDKTDCFLEATWTASMSPNIVKYRVYKGGNLIDTIPATARLVFEQKLTKCKAIGYTLTAVNQVGEESSPVNLQIVSH